MSVLGAEWTGKANNYICSLQRIHNSL